MKKTIIFFVLFAVLCGFSCNVQELHEVGPPSNANATFAKLEMLNDSLLCTTESRESLWTSFKKACAIAGADFTGLAAGVAASKELAGAAALVTGGTGAIAVASFCGLVCGIGASDLAYNACYPSSRAVESEYSPIQIAQALEVIRGDFVGDSPLNPPTDTLKRTIADRILLPTEFEHVRHYGVYHNLTLATLEDVQLGLVSIDDAEVDEAVQSIVNSEEFISTYDAIMAATTSATTTDGLNLDEYIAVEGVYLSGKAKRIYELLLEVYSTYPEDDIDMVELINSYIEIIEESSEFTTEEKEQIYMTLMVAAESPIYWQNLIE